MFSDKLTEEQEELIHVVKEKWFNRFFSFEFDEEKARKLIEFIWTEIMGWGVPEILIGDSPFTFQYVSDKTTDYVQKKVGDKIQEKLMNKFYDEVHDKDFCKIWDEVWYGIRYEMMKEGLIEIIYKIWDNIDTTKIFKNMSEDNKKHLKYYNVSWRLTMYDYYWVAFYDYFKEIGIIENPLFDKYKDLITANIFSCILYKNLAIISKPPKYIKRNEEGYMHCTEGYAIEFEDGYGQYYVNGRSFTEEEFYNYILHEPTAKAIMAVKNQEQRAEIIKYWGYEKIISELKLEELDRYNNKGDEYFLYSCEEFPINFLKLIDTSSKDTYFLGVPRSQKDCLEAIAWTFGLNKEEYLERIES